MSCIVKTLQINGSWPYKTFEDTLRSQRIVGVDTFDLNRNSWFYQFFTQYELVSLVRDLRVNRLVLSHANVRPSLSLPPEPSADCYLRTCPAGNGYSSVVSAGRV